MRAQVPSTGYRRCPGGPLRPPNGGEDRFPRFQVRLAWPTGSRKLEGRRLGLPSCGRRSPHRRAHRHAMRLLIVAALSLPLAMLSSAEQGGAQASPARIQSLQSQLERLNQQADQLVEQYLQAKLELQRTQSMLSSLRSDEQQAAQVLQDAQERLGARAAAAYIQGPGVDLSALLESKNPSDTIDRVQVLDLLARQDGDLMDTLKVAGETYQQRKRALEASQREQARQLASLDAKKRQIDQTVSRTEQLLSQVKAADRAKLLAAANSGSSGSTPVSFPKVTASGGAAKAVAYAKAQVGKPYAYGADGPDSFDCSGLTMMAWAQAGVSLPHSSSAQYSATRRISAGELQPGDLIFYYSPISHVAIYVGGGMQVAATHTGDYVRLQAPHTAGADRPRGHRHARRHAGDRRPDLAAVAGGGDPAGRRARPLAGPRRPRAAADRRALLDGQRRPGAAPPGRIAVRPAAVQGPAAERAGAGAAVAGVAPGLRPRRRRPRRLHPADRGPPGGQRVRARCPLRGGHRPRPGTAGRAAGGRARPRARPSPRPAPAGGHAGLVVPAAVLAAVAGAATGPRRHQGDLAWLLGAAAEDWAELRREAAGGPARPRRGAGHPGGAGSGRRAAAGAAVRAVAAAVAGDLGVAAAVGGAVTLLGVRGRPTRRRARLRRRPHPRPRA